MRTGGVNLRRFFAGVELDEPGSSNWNSKTSVNFEAHKFLAISVSVAHGHIWKEIQKTIHMEADKLLMEIADAYAVLSVSNKVVQNVDNGLFGQPVLK